MAYLLVQNVYKSLDRCPCWRIVNLKIHVLPYVFEEDISVIVYAVEILEFDSPAHTEGNCFSLGPSLIQYRQLDRERKKLLFHPLVTVFEINILFCAPLGCIHFETMRPGFFPCTPLVYSYDN